VSHPLWKISIRRRHAQTVENGDSSHQINNVGIFFFKNLKFQRISNPLYWFKSYRDFVEWVDFANWWSCIGKGLRLQPAQLACYF
jgi:hypothetical protein